MKKFAFSILSLFIGLSLNAQDIKLTNALIVTQLDKQADRFTLEVTISEVFSATGIKNAVSLNNVKEGGDPQILLTDSIQNGLKAKGIDTYVLVSVRGYDKTFKKSEQKFEIAKDLATENLFPLYKDEIASVTLEFHFYRNNQLVGTDLIKIGGANSRETVMKKLRKKLKKRVNKKWK